jgi:acylphosphatase
MQTLSIHITGKVQGVFYRQSAKEKAQELGITGTVKNEQDGSVHIIATGTAVQLDHLIAWCKQGPPRAMVMKVQIAEIPLQSFANFIISR